MTTYLTQRARAVSGAAIRWLFGVVLLAVLLRYFGVSEIATALRSTDWST